MNDPSIAFWCLIAFDAGEESQCDVPLSRFRRHAVASSQPPPSVVGCMAGRVLTLHCWPCAFHVNYDDDGGVATNAIPLALQQTTTTVTTCRQHLHHPSTQVHHLPAGISCAALPRRRSRSGAVGRVSDVLACLSLLRSLCCHGPNLPACRRVALLFGPCLPALGVITGSL